MSDEEKKVDQPLAIYTSNPIANYKVGPFKFEKATLKLYKKDDVKAFEDLLDQLPDGEKIRVKKVDLDAAEAISRKILETQGKASQAIDSTTGDRAPPPAKPVGSLNATLLAQQAAANKQS